MSRYLAPLLFLLLASCTAGPETKLNAFISGYSDDPALSHPVIHKVAGGTGTYNDPITMSVGWTTEGNSDILDYKDGTEFYVPVLKRYFVVENKCGNDCHAGYQGNPWLVVWAEDASCLGQMFEVIQNPAATYEVETGALCAPKQGTKK